jgi:hypothetical protein
MLLNIRDRTLKHNDSRTIALLKKILLEENKEKKLYDRNMEVE